MKVNPEWIKSSGTRLPSSAKLIEALSRAINKPDVDIDQVVRLVSMDMAITSRLLRMANSVSGGANTVYFWRLQNHLS